ncbi:uncharacterized protein BCR38DRAFT_55890 [Pseudomassariella vexata]|uniref:Uncharacterized protein n=1 Tax=Pseudomassariella vexata TaxID=1141098 RepID=A0A1Y2DLN8_9PEZI|nr:uncharacterized protein BCR38DRAFT_55890 [Pseudomassariella vexata]ORY60193.1 hypothetical protein BCR38DRAFT_55890 [Pseudomassariella vexata]
MLLNLEHRAGLPEIRVRSRRHWTRVETSPHRMFACGYKIFVSLITHRGIIHPQSASTNMSLTMSIQWQRARCRLKLRLRVGSPAAGTTLMVPFTTKNPENIISGIEGRPTNLRIHSIYVSIASPSYIIPPDCRTTQNDLNGSVIPSHLALLNTFIFISSPSIPEIFHGVSNLSGKAVPFLLT